MLQKLLTDLQSPRNRYPISKDLHSSQLGHYYFVFEEKKIKGQKKRDRLKKKGKKKKGKKRDRLKK